MLDVKICDHKQKVFPHYFHFVQPMGAAGKPQVKAVSNKVVTVLVWLLSRPFSSSCPANFPSNWGIGLLVQDTLG